MIVGSIYNINTVFIKQIFIYKCIFILYKYVYTTLPQQYVVEL